MGGPGGGRSKKCGKRVTYYLNDLLSITLGYIKIRLGLKRLTYVVIKKTASLIMLLRHLVFIYKIYC
jgi:hypothetical protein